jgi:FtsP/CotA-like multicopper oxidase with cupredoxin domain
MRIARFPGRTVYHCHILDHEDLGMMGLVEARA